MTNLLSSLHQCVPIAPFPLPQILDITSPFPLFCLYVYVYVHVYTFETVPAAVTHAATAANQIRDVCAIYLATNTKYVPVIKLFIHMTVNK